MFVLNSFLNAIGKKNPENSTEIELFYNFLLNEIAFKSYHKLYFSVWDYAGALEIINVAAPSPIKVGENGKLVCTWKAGESNIYSLKWYLGKDEFYRWTPAQRPQIQTFLKNVDLEVDLKTSREGLVSVMNVSLEAGEHILRCEISEEGPAFHTEYKEVILTVVGKREREK